MTDETADADATGAAGDYARAQELLAQIGVEAFAEQPDHPARVECLRIAQRLRRRGCRSVGLVPASIDVGVLGIGINLAIALQSLSGRPVAYVDANQRWPALGVHAGPVAAAVDDPAAPFSMRWLRPAVALLVPRPRVVHGAGLAPLTTLLDSVRDRFASCLVDLTGWRRLGEHLPAFALVDGVAVIARAGLTTEAELLRLHDEIPAERHLGIVLTGAGPESGGRVA